MKDKEDILEWMGGIWLEKISMDGENDKFWDILSTSIISLGMFWFSNLFLKIFKY